MAGDVGGRRRVRKNIGRGQQLRRNKGANECANDQQPIELHVPDPRRPQTGSLSLLFVFVLRAWIVPRTRAALMLAIRDDIVEVTRMMRFSRSELR